MPLAVTHHTVGTATGDRGSQCWWRQTSLWGRSLSRGPGCCPQLALSLGGTWDPGVPPPPRVLIV